ncbi:hypothetical protein M5K25_008819 [Dendrobium thyrsiflorum]|uniref:Uncharacterized protein n=1 Tax=Dendrobium thyrsiflorum TaxID=117978 RepID=A0ABD0VGU7_DENTH
MENDVAKQSFAGVFTPVRSWSCIRLVSEHCGGMTDKGKGLAADEERNLETLWENQANVLRRLDVLSADVQRLSIEVRRECNLNRTRAAPHQLRREQAPTMGPGARRGPSPESSRQSDPGAASGITVKTDTNQCRVGTDV